jgi:hypothetical protein
MFIHIAILIAAVLLIVALVVALITRPTLRASVFRGILGIAALFAVAIVALVTTALIEHA